MKERARVPSTLLQAKPRLTQPGDAAEREADRLADAALSGAATAPLAATRTTTPVMRQAADEHDREYDEDDDFDVAPRARSAVTPAAPAGFLGGLGGSTGRPLEPSLRSRMEHGFGHSFAGVRIHTDGRSADLSDAIDARAFTHDRDIYFASGQYAPGSQAGDRLLAHELAHTLQQHGTPTVARQKAKKKPATPPLDTSRMTDAEKIRERTLIKLEAQGRVKRWREKFDPKAIDPAKRAARRRAFDAAITKAGKIPDKAERAARVGYLEAERELFKDDFYAWLTLNGNADYVVGVGALDSIADPDATFGPAGIAWANAHRARMKAGADVYMTFLAETWAYERRQTTREKLETAETSTGEVGLPDDVAKTPPDPSAVPATGAFDVSTLEDRQLLEELNSELADLESDDAAEYDQTAFLAELAKLGPDERQDFYEFARSLAQPGAAGAQGTPKSLADVLEMFNQLDPASREALKVNREMAEAEPGSPQALPETVRLKLEGEVGAQMAAADDARKIQSDLDRIRAKALPADLQKELSGVDFGVSPFFDEVAMLLGLLAGAGERSTLVKNAGDELFRAIVALRTQLQKELAWLAAETAILAGISIASKGLGALLFGARIRRLIKRLKFVKDLIETARKAYDTAMRVKRVVVIVGQVRETVPTLMRWYQKASTDYARLQRMLEKFDPEEDLEAKLDEKQDELLEKLEEQLEGRLGDILEMLLIEEDTPPDELQKILFDIPRGLTAFESMWQYYRSSEQGKPHFANVLAVRAVPAGRYLFPFVGFASAEIATAFRAAFPDRSLEQRALGVLEKALAKPERRKRHRGLFGRLSRKRYDIEPGALEKLLPIAEKELRTRIEPREPGAGATEHWAPRWFRRVVREEVKSVNKVLRTKTVPATPKGAKKKGAPAPGKEQVPVPRLRVRVRRPRRTDTKLIAKIGFSPSLDVAVDRLGISDFAGDGVDFTGDEQRKEAIRRFLRDEEYDVAPAPAGEHVRIRGGFTGTPKHPYLRIADNRIKQGLEKDDYKPFINHVIRDEHDLPEGYHLAEQKGGVNVSLKKFLAQKGHHQLGLGEGRKLVEGPGRAAAELVAPLTLKKPRLEGFDHVAAIDATLAPAKPGISPFKPQRTRDQWVALMTQNEDLRQRPTAIEGRLGYTIRARSLGGALGSRYLPELREEDDKGHLVARRFGSDVTDPYWNLVPMLRRENQFPGRWYRLESEMADHYVGKGATGTDYVEFGLSLIYPGRKTRRPSMFVAKYQVFDSKGTSKGGEIRKTVEND